MNKSVFCILIPLILYSCSQATAAFTSLVLPVCKKISQTDPNNVSYESCVAILGSDPRSSTSTAPQLARISFELGISRAKDITSTIEKLLKTSGSDPDARNALKYCSGVYSGVPGELDAGLEAIKDEAFDTANERVSAAVKATTACKDGIKGETGKVAPLKQEINEFNQLCAISIGFIKLLRIIN
ncbi:unnamed protein product [Amaranthus hypochondriacus]